VNTGTVSLTGWVLHKTVPVSKLLINGRHYEINLVRPDVDEVYKEEAQAFGFTIELPVKYLEYNVDLELKDGQVLPNIGRLGTWQTLDSRQATGKFSFTKNKPSIVVVDNFYDDPDEVRKHALDNFTFQKTKYHKGHRSEESFIVDGTKEYFETLLGLNIVNWNHDTYPNGKFQWCGASDPIVYHADTQQYAGIVFLTPDAPLRTGTRTLKSILTGARHIDDRVQDENIFKNTFTGRSSTLNFYDGTTFETVDDIANLYNRLVLWDSRTLHAASAYFGDLAENARLFQLFFFDTEDK